MVATVVIRLELLVLKLLLLLSVETDHVQAKHLYGQRTKG